MCGFFVPMRLQAIEALWLIAKHKAQSWATSAADRQKSCTKSIAYILGHVCVWVCVCVCFRLWVCMWHSNLFKTILFKSQKTNSGHVRATTTETHKQLQTFANKRQSPTHTCLASKFIYLCMSLCVCTRLLVFIFVFVFVFVVSFCQRFTIVSVRHLAQLTGIYFVYCPANYAISHMYWCCHAYLSVCVHWLYWSFVYASIAAVLL